MKIAVAALLAVVLVLAWLWSAEVTKNHQLQSEIAGLNSRISDKTSRENLESQNKCAQQAEKMFHQWGYKLSVLGTAYESHYNTKLNKCFMTVGADDFGTPRLTTKFLLDAYERRQYADYMWVADKANRYLLNIPPAICKLTPVSAEERDCKSEEEYKAFVATYME